MQIINGYPSFFEPDFLAEAEPGLADGLSFNEERARSLPTCARRLPCLENAPTGSRRRPR